MLAGAKEYHYEAWKHTKQEAMDLPDTCTDILVSCVGRESG